MRYLMAAFLFSTLSCAGAQDLDDGDIVSMEVLAQTLKELAPPAAPDLSVTYMDERTFDCLDGSVLVKVQWSYGEDPYARRYFVTWDYDGCVTLRYGTIDGETRYSMNNEDKGTAWMTGVNYYADLVYSGSAAGECDAYMTMTKKTEGQVRDLSIREHCPHPVRYWWALWGVPQL